MQPRKNPRALSECYNLADLRLLARRRLPRAIFDYVDGVAEDGLTDSANRTAFERLALRPKILVNVEETDISVDLFGRRAAAPFVLGPTALSRFFHPDGEVAVARAAAAAGVPYVLSTLSSVSLEAIARIGGPRWFQLYCFRDRSLVASLMERAAANGYEVLVLTVDANVAGNRERDLRNGLTIPPQPTLAAIAGMITRPAWLWSLLFEGQVRPANVVRRRGRKDARSLLKYIADELDPRLTWRDAEWIRERWRGPFIIKGVLRAEDAAQAMEIGADGVVVSNHGGRQLDSAPATIRVLPEIAAAVAGRGEIFLDSGVRRGADIVKAMALGARACLIGRPYVFGLAAGGSLGVAKMIELLRNETEITARLLGLPRLDAAAREDVSADHYTCRTSNMSTGREIAAAQDLE